MEQFPRRLAPVQVVEDDVDMRAFLVDALVNAGFQVVTAENGLEALEQMRRENPCVVVLDLGLPLLDGEGFIAAVRSDPEFRPAPIICVSGQPGAREWARQHGIECLSKPVASDVLIATLMRVCQRA